MPYHRSFPTLYDEVKTISASELKKWGYLTPGWKSGIMNWRRRGEIIGSISIGVLCEENEAYCILKYSYRGEPVEYIVKMVTFPSNLGKGNLWYFQCPMTGKRCFKLYGAGKLFLHRDAFDNCMYELQTWSNHTRSLGKSYEAFLGPDRWYEEIYSKHFKKYYAGKPTKRYQKLRSKIKWAKSINEPYYEQLRRARSI